MSIYSATAQWLANMLTPDDGNTPTAVTFGLSLEDIYDRLLYLYQGNNVETVVRNFSAAHAIFDPTKWRWDDTLQALEQIEVTTGAPNIWFDLPIRVPNGSRIAQIELGLDGGTAHGALPLSMPRMDLRSINPITGVVSNLGGQTDTAANAAAYDVVHSIVRAWSAPDVLVARATDDYVIRVRGESSTNSQTGMRVFGAQVSIVTTSRDGGAA